MRRITLVLFLYCLLSCDSNRYEKYQVGHIEVNVDKRISKSYKDEFLKDVEYQVSEKGWAGFSKIKGLTLDSVLFSYLLKIDSDDTVITEKQGILKAYGEDISKDIFNSKPVHFFSTFTNQYYEYDTTSLIRTQNVFLIENDKIELNSQNVDLKTVIAIEKILYLTLSNFNYIKPIRAELTMDSTLITIDLLVDTTQIPVKELKKELANIDPFHLYLAVHKDELLINFKDSLGQELVKGNYFK